MNHYPPGTIGTFLKVMPMGNSREDIRVLYIRRSGAFLYFTYSEGFSLSVATGGWQLVEDCLILDGISTVLKSDCLPFCRDAKEFKTKFKISKQSCTSYLVADGKTEKTNPFWADEMFAFVGHRRFIELRFIDRPVEGVPQEWSAIDAWIDNFMRRNGRTIQYHDTGE